MAIFTPRGLKVRLPIDYAFALMARLYPRVDAFEILTTTEGLASIPALMTFVTGLICFYLQLPTIEIGFYVFMASIIGFIIASFGLFIIPGFDRLGIFYSYISSFGLLLIVLVIYGFFSVGWQGIAVFFIAKGAASIIKMVIEAVQMKQIHSKIGSTISLSEKSFFNAYRIHADRLSKTTNITVSDAECKEENWKPVFEDLAIKYPEVVERFTID